MCRHATRENEIDALLRAGAFVDLYAVVRQSAARGRRALLDQEPRAAVRLRARRRPEGRAPSPAGDGAGARARLPRGSRAERVPQRSRATTATTASRRCGCATGSSSCERELVASGAEIPRPALVAGRAVRGARRAPAAGRRAARATARGRRSRALSARVPARLAPPRGQVGVVGVLPAARSAGGGAARRAGGGRGARSSSTTVERVKRSVVQRFSYPAAGARAPARRRAEAAGRREEVGRGRGRRSRARTIDVLVGPSKLDERPDRRVQAQVRQRSA